MLILNTSEMCCLYFLWGVLTINWFEQTNNLLIFSACVCTICGSQNWRARIFFYSCFAYWWCSIGYIRSSLVLCQSYMIHETKSILLYFISFLLKCFYGVSFVFKMTTWLLVIIIGILRILSEILSVDTLFNVIN